jgi:NAD(P) transhydrogenase subunit alpha
MALQAGRLLCKEKDGNILIDFDDVIMRNMSVINNGKITFRPPAISVTAVPEQTEAPPEVSSKAPKKPSKLKYVIGAAAIVLFSWIGQISPPEFLSHFTVFALACVVGYYVVWNVTHSLHTPLMSVTNAISGIILVGALLQISSPIPAVKILSFIGILIASINIVGGFTVTQRMLKMFNKE